MQLVRPRFSGEIRKTGNEWKRGKTMGDRIQWIEHKGKKILLCDLSKLGEVKYLEHVELMEKELLKAKPGELIPHIVDVSESIMTAGSSARGKQTVKVLSDAGIRTATAMVGVTGIKRIIAQAISRDVFFAKSMEDAKDWVVAQV